MLKNIKEIISVLKSDTSINSLVTGWFFIWEPDKPSEINWIYCIFKTVTTNDVSQVEQKSRIQMILVNSDYDTLSDIDKLIKVKIMTNRVLWNFNYHSVRTNWWLEWVSILKTKTYSRDFIFNYDLNDY